MIECLGIPRNLRIQVSVLIDKPRCDHSTLGIDFLTAAVVDLTQWRDGVAVDRDIANMLRVEQPIDDTTTANDDIVSHLVNLMKHVGLADKVNTHGLAPGNKSLPGVFGDRDGDTTIARYNCRIA